MKRALRFCLVTLVALPLLAQANWYEPYQSAMIAIENQQWSVAASELAKAISIEPNENSAASHRNRKVEYLPHYWLGVARYELGESDAALAEWKTSEAQGSIQKTSRYTDLRRRLSTVESERRKAEGAASSTLRNEADRALQDALSAQMAAVGAGADRQADFRVGQQKLQDALKVVNDAGTDVGEIERGKGLAREARALFEKATKAKQDSRPSAPGPVVKPIPEPPKPKPKSETPKEIKNDPVEELVQEISGNRGGSATDAPEIDISEGSDLVESGDQVIGGPGDQRETPSDQSSQLGERESVSARSDGDLIRRAWDHFANGDVDAAEALLSAVIDTGRGSAEAYLLRGCAVYTRAMMRNQESLLDFVRGDFAEALRRNPELRIEATYFSPRLVRYFDTVRRELVDKS